MLKEFKKPHDAPQDTLHRDMIEIIGWALMVKEKGMRRLEASLAKRGIADPFVKYGLNMVVSGYSPAGRARHDGDRRRRRLTSATAFRSRCCRP